MFATEFKKYTGFNPYPWQEAFYNGLISQQPYDLCDVATGLGKTKVILAWWLARKHRPDVVAQRLIYIVNRRTIVDQATAEVQRLKEQHPEDFDDLLVSTLRGGLADTEEWKSDLTKPAIIIGTPDMIASKLLFGGYGDSKYKRPIHAGILGTNSLIVVDESHLSGPLCATLKDIINLHGEELTSHCQEGQEKRVQKPFIVQLSATSGSTGNNVLKLSQKDLAHPEVTKRLQAKKILYTTACNKGNKRRTIIQEALDLQGFQGGKSRVLVYVQNPDDARFISNSLAKTAKNRVALLTGTLRGHERDLLMENAVVKHFVEGTTPDETIYLVSTSAGEVGWDIDADHLICDLVPLSSMIQRFGRVNRNGNHNNSTIRLVYTNEESEAAQQPLDIAKTNTLIALLTQVGQSVSPEGLQKLTAGLANLSACNLPPTPQLPLREQTLHAWTLTSVSDDLAIKGKLEHYIHGLEKDDFDIYIAWRDEVDHITQFGDKQVSRWLDKYPVKQVETLKESFAGFAKKFKGLQERAGESKVIVYGTKVEVLNLADINPAYLLAKTIILPTSIGGLSPEGIFTPSSLDKVLDVSQTDDRKRVIIKENDAGLHNILGSAQSTKGMIVDKLVLNNGEATYSFIVYKNKPRIATDQGPRTILLSDHQRNVGNYAYDFARQLGLNDVIANTMRWAGERHDDGKGTPLWQASVYNTDLSKPLAKSQSRGMNSSLLFNGTSYYRHELESYRRALLTEPPDNIDYDLGLYLISAHHGHGRPHFKPMSCLDHDVQQVCKDVAARLGRLQAKYGCWGLAYLHAIFCSADAKAS